MAMGAGDVTVGDILKAIDHLAGRRKIDAATRHEIAKTLVVEADDISEDRKLTGPLLQAVEAGFVEQDPRSGDYWRLTSEGQSALDSGTFMS